MRRTLTIIAILAACSPKSPQDSDTDGDGSTGSTSDGPPASSSSTDAPEPATSESATSDPTTGGDPTTDGEFACPEGHPSLAPLWSASLPVTWADEPPQIGSGRHIGALADGRLAVDGYMYAGSQAALGVFLVAPDGSASEWFPAPLEDSTQVLASGLQVAADGTIVMVASRDPQHPSPLLVSRFSADGVELARADLAAKNLIQPADMALFGETDVIVAGYDFPAHNHWLARFDVATGAAAWEVELPGKDIATERHLALGPGGEIVVGHGLWPNDGDRERKVWRVDQDGQLVWELDLDTQDSNSGRMQDLVITPAGLILVVTMTTFPESRVSVTGVALADGARLWDLDVAHGDALGDPYARLALVDADALTLPIVRGPDFASAGHEANELAVHRVSFTGEHLGATPLQLDGLEKLQPWFSAARGSCGELIIHQPLTGDSLFAAFAP